jgi:hypothetical protein
MHSGVVFRAPWVIRNHDCVWLCLLKRPLHLPVTLSALFRLGSKYLLVVPESTWLAGLRRGNTVVSHRLRPLLDPNMRFVGRQSHPRVLCPLDSDPMRLGLLGY